MAILEGNDEVIPINTRGHYLHNFINPGIRVNDNVFYYGFTIIDETINRRKKNE